MDQETIQKLAAEIVRHLPSYPWGLLAVQLILTLLAAVAGAFFGEYFKTRGKNFATKADFDSLLEHLRAKETIKADVGQKDWAKREWTNLRRIKLEELLAKTHDCRHHLDQFRHSAMDGKRFSERDPHAELQTITDLYFHELAESVRRYLKTYEEVQGPIMNFALSLAEIQQVGPENKQARQLVWEAFKDEYERAYPKMLEAEQALRTASSKLLREMMGVSE